MGNFIASKHQLIKLAIEHRDRNGILSLIRSSSQEQVGEIFRNELFIDGHRTTLLHYAAWQGAPFPSRPTERTKAQLCFSFSSDNADLLQLILEFVDDLEVRDEHGWTPLMAAVHRGSKSNLNILLERQADINCDFSQGMHLIAVAMMFHDLGRKTTYISRSFFFNENFKLFFFSFSHRELIEILLRHGAKVTNSNNKNPMHCYLLHFAVDEGLHDITELILSQKQIPIDTINDRGWTPLHIAVGHNRLDLVQLLIEHGAHINARVSSTEFHYIL